MIWSVDDEFVCKERSQFVSKSTGQATQGAMLMLFNKQFQFKAGEIRSTMNSGLNLYFMHESHEPQDLILNYRYLRKRVR